MIVKMSKYSFLIYHKEYDKFLDDLQDIGVVHIIERSDEIAEDVRNKINLIKRIESAIKHLKIKVNDGKCSEDIKSDADNLKAIADSERLSLDIDQNHQKLHQLNKELHYQEPWGDFSIETVNKLQQSGVELKLFVTSIKSFNDGWKEKYTLEIIRELSGNLYFAVFYKTDEIIDIKADEIKIFDRSISDIKAEIHEVKDKIKADNKLLHDLAHAYLKPLESFRKTTENDKQFTKIYTQARTESEGKMMVLEGWIPETSSSAAKKYLDENKTVYLEGEPSEEELSKVPILMKNNNYASMFEPIGKLFSLPAYAEIDLTMYFAPFFMLFFGFCLGDAGYGFVLITAAGIAKLKLNKEFKPLLTLVQLMGIMTIVMGMVGGTFFGVDLKVLDWKFKDLFLNSNSMFWLALGLGVVQILFGMTIKAANLIKQKGFIYSVSTFGWMIMVISLVGMSLKAVMGYLRVEQSVIESMTYLNTISAIGGKTVLVGVAMILLFNDPKANLIIRILKGMWQLYDITGLFGDVLSYIRLFALGVSGGILGLVINSIASEFLGIPYVGWLIWIVFLIIGHTGNILLSGLGSFVHPMRLTFVEFYKNAGWTGGGKEYKPFKKNA